MTNLPEIPDVAFSQRKNLLTRLERLQHIFSLRDHYRNPGLCLALSIEYLIAQRQHGPFGGRDYILWLKSLLESDDPHVLTITQQTSVKDLEKILRNRFRHQHLSTVLRDLIRLHASQNLEIESIKLRKSVNKQNQGCLSCLSGSKNSTPENLEKLATAHRRLSEAHADYGKKIESNGLQILKPEKLKIVSPLRTFVKKYVDFMQSLENTTHNQSLNTPKSRVSPARSSAKLEPKYFLIGTKSHAMAITFHRIENESIWSFFDSNRGVYLYKDYKEFKSFMDGYFFKALGPKYEFYESQEKETARIDYLCLSEIDTEHYEGIWKNFRQKENIYVIDALIKEGKDLFFTKNTTARLLEYSLNETDDINSIRVRLTNDNNIITVNAPFSCLSDLYAATMNRIDHNERLVLNIDSVNPFGSLTPASDLSGQVKQAIRLINKLALEEMHFTFIYKDSGYHKVLRDFFYDKKNPQLLNQEKLLYTVFNDSLRIAWLKEADQILRIAEAHQEWFKGIPPGKHSKKCAFGCN